MIKRIVKLRFKAKQVDNFIEIFDTNKAKILSFKGCQHLELWQDAKDQQTFFTYSIWDSEDDLNAYRKSDFFRNIWPLTKARFASEPEAWTVTMKS